MKIPYSWLAEYVDLSGVDAHEVARLLTLHTCEVEAVHEVGAGLEKIVIGEVVEAVKHPNADSLRVTKVNIGTGELLPIICGAPNVANGQRVAIAPPGVKLPSGLEIGERKIRGEISRGMICSEKELGLGEDHDGIIVLEPEAVVGANLTGLPSIHDWVIEIDNKSINHRPDLWGIFFMAWEVAAICKRDQPSIVGLINQSVIIYNSELHRRMLGTNTDESSRAISVDIQDKSRCSRYVATVIDNVDIAPSHPLVQRRLRLVGARSVSNVVDVSNYVMFELSQPTHAFDLKKIRGSKIVVRTARQGESLVTLDSQRRALLTTDLVIADAEGPIAIAGVMGGLDSEVTKETSSIVLESATFEPTTVRRTATRLGLRSEASTRFEKTLPWNGPSIGESQSKNFALLAAERVLSLATVNTPCSHFPSSWTGNMSRDLELNGFLGPKALVRRDIMIADGIPLDATAHVEFSWSFVAARLGIDTVNLNQEKEVWRRDLDRLGISLDETRGENVVADIPYFRATKDLTEPIDLVEEIARLRGYDKIEPKALTAAVIPPPSQGNRRLLVRRVEDRLSSVGFRGLESYSFLSDALIDQLGIQDQPYVKLNNSLVADQSRVRREVLPSLLGLLVKNLTVEPDLRLFEVGKGYRPETRRIDPYVDVDKSESGEVHSVAGVVALAPEPSKGNPKAPFDKGAFYAVKGFVAALLNGLDLTLSFAPGGPDAKPYFHPQRRLDVRAGDLSVGSLGQLHPSAATRLGLGHADVAGFELDLASLEAAVAAAGPRRFTGIPRFPGITVDVALAGPASIRVARVEALIREAGPGLCRGLTLFDIYAGAELGDGRRSVAFHVELRADDRTLTDADENGFLRDLAKRGSAEGLELRGWKG